MSLKQAIKNIINPIRKRKEIKFRESFAQIGKATIVKSNSQLVPRNMYLDDYVLIQDNNNFISHKGKLFVKKYSVISSGCIIVPSTHMLKVGVPFYLSAMKHIGDVDKDIIIEEDCWIGAGCILLPGITIGRGCVVGAGSVVTKNLPPYSVSVGSPSKIIATKFDYNDCISHEQKLYSSSERLDSNILKHLFEGEYKNLRAIGDSFLTKADQLDIEEFFNEKNE